MTRDPGPLDSSGDNAVLATRRRGPAGRLACALLALAAPLLAADVAVERVAVQQNRVLPQETLLYYVSTRAGDRYDERRLKDDFRRLWETGFLEDLLLDVQDGERGKLVTFVVRERPRIRIVDYRGSKALTTTKINERLKDDAPRLDTFYDPRRARRAEGTLKRMLEDQGFPFAEVRHEVKPLGSSGVQVSFVIEDGLKAFVKTVAFAGNSAFSDGALKRRMKKIKERRFWSFGWLTGRTTFSPEKWEADQRSLTTFLLDNGRVDVSVGEPALKYSDGRSGFFKRRPVKWLRLDIPITEGPAYRVGEVRFEGLAFFKDEQVRPLFDLHTGDPYRESRIQKGYERLRDAYGSRGYIQATGSTQRTPDPERRVVDLVLRIEEDKRYHVGRILFTGNDTTRDKVVRRELFLSEGDVLDTELLKLSIRRLNQLGYFKTVEIPELTPSPRGDETLDVTFRVQEQNRTQLALTAGVSPVEGTTFTASYANANFLGAGKTLQVAAQRGSRLNSYQLGVSEPYLFDRPISAGFEVAKRDLLVPAATTNDRPGYRSRELVTRLSTGLFVGRFTRLLGEYAWGVVQIDPTAGGDPSLIDAGRRRESRFTPSLVYNTVDSPWTPRRGLRLSASLPLAGGPLGGTVSLLEPGLKAIGYVPLTRRTAFGLRAEAGWLLPFGDTARADPATGRDGIPFDRRFLLGGETQIRGFDTLSVGPRDSKGALVGGNKFVVASAEHYYDLGPVRAVLFLDAGQAFAEGNPIDLGRLRTSTGVELRFLVPVLNIPVRVYKAWNLDRDPTHKASALRFTFGTSF